MNDINKQIDSAIERYELLCEDIKYQIDFIGDFYEMDFTHLIETLTEMKKLQDKYTKNG